MFAVVLLLEMSTTVASEPGRPPRGWVPAPPPATEQNWQCAHESSSRWEVKLVKGELQIAPKPRTPNWAVPDEPEPLSMDLPGGRLVAIDHGEFGGWIVWRDSETKATEKVVKDHTVQFISYRTGIFAVTGSSHMSPGEGRVLALARDPNGKWSARAFADFEGAPITALRLDDETILVLTMTGVVRVELGTGRREVLRRNDKWYQLYVTSMVTLGKSIFIGGRHGIIRLTPAAQGYQEEWWVPQSCRRFGPGCRCAR